MSVKNAILNRAPGGVWWDHDEFSNLVETSLIALYEDVNIPDLEGESIGVDPLTGDNISRSRIPGIQKLTWADLRNLQRLGPYFAPNDRLTSLDCIHHEVDGFPDEASNAFGHIKRGSDEFSGYAEMYYAKRVMHLPRGVVLRIPCRPVAYYRLSIFYPQNSGGMEGFTTYVGVLANGKSIGVRNCESASTHEAICTGTVSLYADSRYVWNVQCVVDRGLTRATFGVYQDQIKSLFYARQTPRTKAQRLRPILHWVRAHTRRMQSGVDINIDKHLRGIDAFYMDGTEFRITRPRKALGGKQNETA